MPGESRKKAGRCSDTPKQQGKRHNPHPANGIAVTPFRRGESCQSFAGPPPAESAGGGILPEAAGLAFLPERQFDAGEKVETLRRFQTGRMATQARAGFFQPPGVGQTESNQDALVNGHCVSPDP